jgi:hypothetical protein
LEAVRAREASFDSLHRDSADPPKHPWFSLIPRLPDLITVCAGAGGLIGAIIGFMMRAENDATWVANTIAGGALGGIAGTAVAFAIWIGGTLGT